MTKIRSLVLALSLTLSPIALPACHPPTSVQTPAGKAAYTADQVLTRIEELQSAAIQANTDGGLDDKTSILVVRFTVDAAKTLKAVPAGWQATVREAFTRVKAQLTPDQIKKLGLPFAIVEGLIASMGGDL